MLAAPLRSTYFFCSPKISGCLKYVWLIVQQEQGGTMRILSTVFFFFLWLHSFSIPASGNRERFARKPIIFLITSSIDAMLRIYLIWKYSRLYIVETKFPFIVRSFGYFDVYESLRRKIQKFERPVERHMYNVVEQYVEFVFVSYNIVNSAMCFV